jgi:putative DNA primase/helicase
MTTDTLEKKVDAPTTKPEPKKEFTEAELIALAAQALAKHSEKKETHSIEFKYIFRKVSPGHDFHWDYRKDGNILFKWTGEYWQQQVEETIKEEISLWLKKEHPAKFSSKNLNSIYAMFIASTKSFESIQTSETIIPTKKHWLLVDEMTGDITAIVPDKRKPIRSQIDLVVPKAGPFKLPEKEQPSTPKKDALFHNFVRSSLGTGAKKSLVQEYAGYTLTNSVRKQVLQMWLGDGANGKSVMIYLLSKAHTKAISVKLEKVHEYNSNLISSTLIYCTETKKSGFDQEFVKQAVSGDMVEIREIYLKKQNAQLTAKWIMLMNATPLISDYSDGLFRRIQLINWDAQFNGENGNPEPIEDLEKLIYANEMDDFIIWCLQGLQRLIKNKWKFTVCEQSQKAITDLKNTADKVRLFVSENNYQYVADQKQSTSKKKIFEYFNKWADENNFEQMNSTTFWMRMSNIFKQIKTDGEKKINGERIVYIKAQPKD